MRTLLFATLLLFSTPSLAQPFGEVREYFGDWLAACRPSGYCSATTYDNPNPADGSVADHILRVGRHERGLYWEVSLTTVAGYPDEYADIIFKVDGQTSVFEQGVDYGAYSSINDFYFVSQQAEKLLDQLVAGTSAQAKFLDEYQELYTANFSLSGLTAALLWIDERQRRLGSERLAYAAPIGLTPISAQFPRSVPNDLIIQHSQDAQCEPFENLRGAYRVITQQVDEEHWVYFIPCTSGAYNFAYKAYEGNGTYYDPIYFAEFDELSGWTGTQFLINPIYDPTTKILTSFYKGRGIGDCGTTGKWVWRDYRFIMLEYRAKYVCDAQGEPGVFPLVFELEPSAKLK